MTARIDLGEQGRDPFHRAANWLYGIAEMHDASGGDLALKDQLRLLFGLWICDQVLPDSVAMPALTAMVRRVEATLEAEAEAESFDPIAFDATLLFMAARIVRDCGGATLAIDDFAQQVAAALGELPSIPPRFANEALLLASVGFDLQPPVPRLTANDIESDALALLRADKTQVRAICATIAAATHYGRNALRGDPTLLQTLRLVLPPMLLEILYRGDIDTGAPLLRTLHYLRLTRTRAVRMSVNALMGQQQPDGKFGFFTALASEMSHDEGYSDPINLDIGLHLPITVSCLWALAETTSPGFSVLNAPRLHGRVAAPLTEVAHGD